MPTDEERYQEHVRTIGGYDTPEARRAWEAEDAASDSGLKYWGEDTLALRYEWLRQFSREHPGELPQESSFWRHLRDIGLSPKPWPEGEQQGGSYSSLAAQRLGGFPSLHRGQVWPQSQMLPIEELYNEWTSQAPLWESLGDFISHTQKLEVPMSAIVQWLSKRYGTMTESSLPLPQGNDLVEWIKSLLPEGQWPLATPELISSIIWRGVLRGERRYLGAYFGGEQPEIELAEKSRTTALHELAHAYWDKQMTSLEREDFSKALLRLLQETNPQYREMQQRIQSLAFSPTHGLNRPGEHYAFLSEGGNLDLLPEYLQRFYRPERSINNRMADWFERLGIGSDAY